MSTEMTTCAMCGTQMPANVRFCPECGAANARMAASNEGSSLLSNPGDERSGSDAAEARAEGGAAEGGVGDRAEESKTDTAASDVVADGSLTGTGADSTVDSDSRYTPSTSPTGSSSAETASFAGSSYGTPTVNIGQGSAGESARTDPASGYTPPPSGSYTGGQYGSNPAYGGSPQSPGASGQPQYTPYAQAQGQGQGQAGGQYSPPPQYGQSRGQSQYGQYSPPQPPYGQGQGQQGQYSPPQYGQTQNVGQGGTPAPPTYYSQAPIGYPQQGMVSAQRKDPTTALLLELIGYLGFLGIGHMYAGKTGRGIALLIGYWVYIVMAVLLTIVLVGCLMFALMLVIPIASGFWIKTEMEREQGLRQ